MAYLRGIRVRHLPMTYFRREFFTFIFYMTIFTKKTTNFIKIKEVIIWDAQAQLH